VIAEHETAPNEDREVDREQGVADEGSTDLHVGLDSAAEVTGEKHGTQDRGARDAIEGGDLS
jgi:hypothetical protein